MATTTAAPELDRALAENARYAAQFDRSDLPAAAGPASRRPRLHGRAPDGRGRPRPADRRRAHHPQRRRPGHRRRDPLAGHQPAPPRDRGGHRHRAHRLRDAHVRGRAGPIVDRRGDRRRRRPRARSFPDLEANLRAQVDRIRSHPWVKPSRSAASSTRSRPAAFARSPPDLPLHDPTERTNHDMAELDPDHLPTRDPRPPRRPEAGPRDATPAPSRSTPRPATSSTTRRTPPGSSGSRSSGTSTPGS